ncbi:DMT family transporter [Alkalicoccus urumqiensis]|uniref:EamA-like transporter family protein n=1 Tax=Alkalicoccus urumqiensis TaxID=1548213 RepID=A0A2P6MIZ3_ALKUR|nr:DMT family transporter [Alkalicoccus urumqiensis]PRO66247.1 hypothetical protein C6I21_05445 [Alkalicoccus urumqiensis]
MKGIIFALGAGMFITLQGVANAFIGTDIGTWNAAFITQAGGFAAAMIILILLRDTGWKQLLKAKPLYLASGAFAAVILFGNMEAIYQLGATVTVAVILIAQLALTFAADARGWFEIEKKEIQLPQILGCLLMAGGVIMLQL